MMLEMIEIAISAFWEGAEEVLNLARNRDSIQIGQRIAVIRVIAEYQS